MNFYLNLRAKVNIFTQKRKFYDTFFKYMKIF